MKASLITATTEVASRVTSMTPRRSLSIRCSVPEVPISSSVFRRSPAGYWCYQEPLHEYIRHVADAPDRLLEISSRDGSLLRHPTLDKPYFWEFYQVRDAIAPLFRKELSYDGFFATTDSSSFRNLVSYLRALIDTAQGRPFFQCCRTTGRSTALREALAGTHIHLWRNPHDQWWSYQVGDYFNATTQRIFNAADLPPPLLAVKASCGIADFHDDDIDKELAHDRNRRLAAREDYVSFYALWLYSMLACDRTADLSLNIDALTMSAAYRQRVLDALARDRNRRPEFFRLQYCAGTLRRGRSRVFRGSRRSGPPDLPGPRHPTRRSGGSTRVAHTARRGAASEGRRRRSRVIAAARCRNPANGRARDERGT